MIATAGNHRQKAGRLPRQPGSGELAAPGEMRNAAALKGSVLFGVVFDGAANRVPRAVISTYEIANGLRDLFEIDMGGGLGCSPSGSEEL
jgi:hypothetical protein